MQPVAKGIVRVAGATQRVVRLTSGQYNRVGVLAGIQLGACSKQSQMGRVSRHTDDGPMADIFRTAIQGVKTNWVGRRALG